MERTAAIELLSQEVARRNWPLGEVGIDAQAEYSVLKSNISEASPRVHLVLDRAGNLLNRGVSLAAIGPEPYVPLAWLQSVLPFRIISGSRQTEEGLPAVTTSWEHPDHIPRAKKSP